jgi:hypothetical protein
MFAGLRCAPALQRSGRRVPMRARRTRRHRRLRQSFASLTARNTPWQNRAASRPAPSCGPYAFTHPDRRIAMTRLPLAPLSAAASRIVTIRA